MITTLRSLVLDVDHKSQQHTDLFAHALIVWVWLVAGYQAQLGRAPPEKNLCVVMGVYFLSAYNIIIESCKIELCRLEAAIQYWERRPLQVRIDHIWMDQPCLGNIPAPDVSTPCSRNESADEYIRGLETEGKSGLCFKIVEKDELIGGHTSLVRQLVNATPDLECWTYQEIIDLLASIHKDILTSLIDGSLSRKAEVKLPTNEVNKHLERMCMQRPSPPALCINILCDLTGCPPTPAQWQTVVQ